MKRNFKNQLFVFMLGTSLITSSMTTFANDKKENINNNTPISKEQNNEKTTTIQSESMVVTIDKFFPRVEKYELNGKIFEGQKESINTLKINDINIPIEKNNVTTNFSNNKAEYTIRALDNKNNIDVTLKMNLSVEKNILSFKITEITSNNNQIIKTIDIPNHSLISLTSNSTDAQFAGAALRIPGKTTGINVRENMDTIERFSDLNTDEINEKGYLYTFLSNGQLSAGIWSNSENNGQGEFQRIIANAKTNEGKKTVSLKSNFYTYQKDEGYRVENGILKYKATGDYKDAPNKTVIIDELPEAKVVITENINGDSKADWQDGAIAYRSIMNNPRGWESVPDLVAYRINMTFGSQGQNPFLKALDGVKKIALNTDNLGQSILLKGYGSEGHDSGHLDYANIGKRIGGVEDMKYLLKEAGKYGAEFGIHINASETYPESKYFTEERLRRNEDGSINYGWNWIDQGININADYDLKNGRMNRLYDLYNILAEEDGKNNLDWIYVDVWGNGQSGDNTTWPSRQLAKEINGLDWNLGGEWGYAFEYDSIFQHWAADLTYGGFNYKGFNSDIARFIRNHQKDAWIGNYTSYGGEADAPLLGGYSMKDFEGWQGRSDYGAYIKNLFEVNVPTKFIQHYQVTNLKEGNSVTMKDEEGKAYKWTPSMEAKLKREDGAGSGELIVQRKSNDFVTEEFVNNQLKVNPENNLYRTRVMTFKGKKIYEGLQGMETMNVLNKDDVKTDINYLIPWYWGNQEDPKTQKYNDLKPNEYKLYFYNSNQEDSNWELNNDWENVKTLYMYELTDLGKANEVEIPVVNGKITIPKDKYKPETPYVLHKEKQPMLQGADGNLWSDGMKIKDSGFNSGNLKHWTIEGAKEGEGVSVEKSQGSNSMLKIENNKSTVSLTQKVEDLEPNTAYAVYVGVDNRSEKDAIMEIKVDDKVYSNSAPKSLAKNYVSAYAHNTLPNNATINDTSYFQNMYIFFETGDNVDNVYLTLKRDANKNATYFDDIIFVKNDSKHWNEDKTIFTQDFENVAQGIYPFVVSSIEGVVDNRTHLAEANYRKGENTPNGYTQRGALGGIKKLNDVITGNWSVKTNGLVNRKDMVYQTIPQNFKFEPNVKYKVTFDYEAGSTGTYRVVWNNVEHDSKNYGKNNIIGDLESTINKEGPQTFTFEITGTPDGQTWFGIESTDVNAVVPEGDEKNANFAGYYDLVIDNLKIEKIS